MFDKKLIERLPQREKALMVRNLIENMYSNDADIIQEDTFLHIQAVRNSTSTSIDITYQIKNTDGTYEDRTAIPTVSTMDSLFKSHRDMPHLGSDYFNGAYALAALMLEVDSNIIFIKSHFGMIDISWHWDETIKEYKEGNTYWGDWYELGVPSEKFDEFEAKARAVYEAQYAEWELHRQYNTK